MACKHVNYYGTTVGCVCRDCGEILKTRPDPVKDPEPVETPAADPEIEAPAKKAAPAKKTKGRTRK